MAECAVARAARLEADGRDLLLAGDPVAPGEVLANDAWAEKWEIGCGSGSVRSGPGE
jgi:hypothetical protein